jgi:prevent-host-death family protein
MTKSKEIAAGEFKAKCLQIMDSVQKTKNSILITKRGKPVAKLVPVDGETADFYGCMKGSIKIVGDIMAPIDAEWEANA